LQPAHAERGQGDTYHPVVAVVDVPADETGALSPVDQPHRAVVPEEQVAGDVADRGVGRLAAYREQQLVLRRGDAGGGGLPLAPVQEPPEGVPELQEVRV